MGSSNMNVQPGSLLVAGVSLVLMVLNAWISYRPQTRLADRSCLPHTSKEWGSAVIRLFLAGMVVWLVVVGLGLEGFNWQVGLFAMGTTLFAQKGVAARLKIPIVLFLWAILGIVLAYPSLLSAQLVWLAPQVALSGALWWVMRIASSKGLLCYRLAYLPFWLGLTVVAAVFDTAFRLDAATISGLVTRLGIMPVPETTLQNTVWEALFYEQQLFGIGALTLYAGFMLIGVLAIWAFWADQPILVTLPLLGWLVGMYAALLLGWPIAALPVSLTMVAATCVAAWVAGAQGYIFGPPLVPVKS